MASYVVLINWTEKGVMEAKDTTNRAQKVRELAQSMGGDMPTIYWTLGRYDAVCVLEAPDDETATAMLLKAAGSGAVRTETLRAFNTDEMTGILANV